MKEVLISINPKWCELIASGKKTIEIRKSKPKLETPFKVYIYCTKGKFEPHEHLRNNLHYDDSTIKVCEGQGKVIGEFLCYRLDTVGWISSPDKYNWKDRYNEKTCLTNRETYEYTKGELFYEWYISNLIIYDKPRELYDFVNYDKHEACLKKNCFSGDCWCCPNNAIVIRPPQSWCYVKNISYTTQHLKSKVRQSG